MQTLKIHYVDFWHGFEPETYFITKILQKHYEVIFDKDNPDLVFCSIFGNKYLDYSCPRIVFCGEPQTPDFNLYDYAIGFDHISFLDRYVRYPLYLTNSEFYTLALDKHKLSDEELLGRNGFCSFVVSAGGGEGDVRTKAFLELSKYKKVASGGRFMNNLEDGQPVPDKLEFQKNYKFAFAMENSKVSGYTTEKIVDAWAAGCIPIFWGNPDIALEFNKDSYIDVSDFECLEDFVSYVKSIDENDEKYLQMCHTPILKDGHVDEEKKLEEFLINIVEKKPNERIVRSAALTQWGRFYEHRIRQMVKLNKNPIVEFARKTKRRFFGLKKI